MGCLLHEQDLLLQISKGDAKAFDCLYKKYEQPIYHFVLKYVRSITFAEDITQEIFMKIWENRSKLNTIKTFRKYLFTTAKNHTINKLKQYLHTQNARNELFIHVPISANSTVDSLQSKEYSKFISKAINNLPLRTYEVFHLCREEGKSYKEAASTLGVSRNAIKNHMISAMKKLSSVIEKKLDITLCLCLLYQVSHKLFYFFTTLF